jgi:hypothetical protein
MHGRSGALSTQVFEGAFSSAPLFMNGERRFPSAPAGAGAFVAPVGGTIQGRFGWGNTSTHTVANTRVTASDQLGIVLPLRVQAGAMVIGGGWTWQFYDPAVRAFRIRQGLNVTLMAEGNFWLRFAGGAYAGEPVYASLVDGSAISGETSDAEPTPWTVCSNAGPGELAMVSTYAKFGD